MPATYSAGNQEFNMIEESFKIPREVIIVEGRDDTTRLIETFGPDIKEIGRASCRERV